MNTTAHATTTPTAPRHTGENTTADRTLAAPDEVTEAWCGDLIPDHLLGDHHQQCATCTRELIRFGETY